MSQALDTAPTTTALTALAKPRRRYLLATLLGREDTSTPDATSESMSVATLATEVAATERDCPIVTDDQRERTLTTLVHTHIPRLIDHGILTRRGDGETTAVALADHPLLETEWVRALLADPTGEEFPAPEATLNRTLEALRRPRYRTVCTVLARQRGTVSVADLAALVVAQEDGDGTRLVDVTEAACTAAATMLVHEALPALSDAGLVAYDDAERRVGLATDAPQWGADWLLTGPLADAADPIRTVRDRTGGPASAGPATTDPATEGSTGSEDACVNSCRTIRGRESVVTAGLQIADNADEELFVTVPDPDLIQQTCLEHWRKATERGVDVYVGSHSPRVRDTIRSAVPEATVCEPRLDWLNFPIERGNHGRIVFADRTTAMIVTVDDARSETEPRIGAITGHGRRNALVSLVCEHMCPRLDRLTTEGDAKDGTPLSI
ncbi:DUF7344 domain-containing protein [Natrinema longum]|uniref:DUF7344 domain-containing protein n=1 Tax=Natrinema longum TaxID=370324 RepID=A0A8A2U550_9EURY|nr:hypothetical protein [Natrinema longum]MBZ6494634.1 hypothetical protein [Natrinema longum]QSW84049.1 hypothetical protein J0X27_11325 [Natrinema longum]